jgi:hypothetical protein
VGCGGAKLESGPRWRHVATDPHRERCSEPKPAAEPSHRSDSAYRPVAYLRLAQINERQGKPAEAIQYYQRFVELWQDADPELQPRLQAAQRTIAALSVDDND